MPVHFHLRTRLQPIVARRSRARLWATLAACWAIAAGVGLALLAFEHLAGWRSALVMPFVALLGVVVAVMAVARRRPAEPDWRALARQIEGRHPDLDARLLTAVQQEPPNGGRLNYLQERLLYETALHSRRNQWTNAFPRSRVVLAHFAHALAVVLFVFTLWQLRLTGGHAFLAKAPGPGVTVTPGDTTLERGDSLVVLARFSGSLPADVTLVMDSSGTLHRIPLVKSLADPVFGGSVSEVANSFTYHVEYGSHRTRDYNVTVFERPRLESADADLTYPAYTGESPKHIADTRSLSAVEGSRLDLTLNLNKPVASARLVPLDRGWKTVPLQVETNRPEAALRQFPLQASQNYVLQLVDADGRTNKMPARFAFAVLTNRPPELRLTSPRGDLRPSPLQEITFAGTVWDDFGVRAYGLAYTVAGHPTKFLRLGGPVPARQKHPFNHVLRLEKLHLQPDQLISWFVWAEDIGPDGRLRRTPGDLYFAAIRPFDEIFRQGEGMAGQSSSGASGQQGGQSARLAEMQKEIISATWNLQRRQSDDKAAPLNEGDKSTSTNNLEERQSSVLPLSDRFPLAESTLPSLPQFAGQVAPGADPVSDAASSDSSPAPPLPQNLSDPEVVREAQAEVLQRAKTALSRQRDPRTAALWQAAIQRMERALAKLKDTSASPGALAEALTEEQSAYEALLRLQEHEYQVARSRNGRAGGGAGSMMQRRLDQLQLTRSENRYETQSQAEAPQSTRQREQLKVMARLRELARRQQDLNARLQELQTALQAARTEQEREDIQRQLKRLREQEQQMLADVDQLRQQMDQPQNQSSMNDARRQLEQTRNDMQRTVQAARDQDVARALASGTRAQRQLQQIHDELRKASSSRFAEDMRELRRQARQLAGQQEDLVKQMQSETNTNYKSLSDSASRDRMLDELVRQKQLLTNLVERATRVSQQAENPEPLLSRQLYDSIRQFSQDNAKDVREVQDNLLRNGLMTRSLYERLRNPAQSDGARLMDVTSEMLRMDFLPPASDTAQRSLAGIDQLKQGIERAAKSVLGDETESLRMAQQELTQLTNQLHQEITRAEGGNQQTNASGLRTASATPSSNSTNQVAGGLSSPRPQSSGQTNETARAEGRSRAGQNRMNARAGGSRQAEQEQASNRRGSNARSGQRAGGTRGPGTAAARNGGAQLGSAAGGGGGADLSGSLGRAFNRVLNRDAGAESDPITGDGFGAWFDRLRDVQDMLDQPALRNEVAAAGERARLLRRQYKHDLKKPDWAVVRLQVMQPLAEVSTRIAEELARRQSRNALVPIDRDPVPDRYSELVQHYYEELGKADSLKGAQKR